MRCIALFYILTNRCLGYYFCTLKSSIYGKDIFQFVILHSPNNDPVSFHTRCKELASVKRLSNYHIVNDSLRLSDCRRHRRSNLTPAEKEFLCLMEAGFSNRALCVIFRVGKVGSIYVKHHRIKAKIVNVNKSVGGD